MERLIFKRRQQRTHSTTAPRGVQIQPSGRSKRWLGIALCVMVCTVATSTRSAYSADGPHTATVATSPDPVLALVNQAVEINKHRHLDAQRNRPWEILHGLLALRNDYVLKNGDSMVNAMDWISEDATFKGSRWFQATQWGAKAHPYNGTPYDFEGHVNQTLAIISMCDLPRDHVFKLPGGKTATMADMIRHAQMAVNDREEVAWTLWFLTHYLDQDTHWVNAQGEKWSMERLVKLQLAHPPYNAPCGGCHGFFALAYARNSYLQKHGQLRGVWLEADQQLQQFITASKNMQNRDGSFATQFYKARGFSRNFNERIKSSGHIIEWLMIALPKRRLDEQWVRLGVQRLAQDLIENASQPADCGPLYHSLHALILYQQRMQPQQPVNPPKEELAQQPVEPLHQTGPVTLSSPDDESMPNYRKPAASDVVAQNEGTVQKDDAQSIEDAPAADKPSDVAVKTAPEPPGAASTEATPPTAVAKTDKPASPDPVTLKAAEPESTTQVTPKALAAPEPKVAVTEPKPEPPVAEPTADPQAVKPPEPALAQTPKKSHSPEDLAPRPGAMPILRLFEEGSIDAQMEDKRGPKLDVAEGESAVIR